MTQESQPERVPIDYSDIEERFADIIGVHSNAWSTSINFGLRSTRPTEEPDKFNVRVRVPLTTAKVLAILILRQIRDQEQTFGITIDLPPPVLEGLGIPPEDWRRLDLA